MSKLKEPLFYSLHRRWGNFRVVAVTTYKEHRGRWHGRYVQDNEATHGRGDIEGRFDTPEAAQAAIAGLEAIGAKHKPFIDVARKAYDAAQRAEREEVDTYLKGLPR